MSSATVEPSATVDESLPREYGFSSLITGIAKMWRGSAPGFLAIIVSAVLNALLVMGNPVAEWSISFIAMAIVSAIIILYTSAILHATALETVYGTANLKSVFARANGNLGLFTIWTVGLWIVATIGYAIFTFPGIIIVALTPYIGLAAIDGQGNAFAANFKALSARPIRWAVTIILIGIMSFVLFLLAAVNQFFIGGFVGSLISVFVLGMFAWWWLTTWACLYRSTPVGVVDDQKEAL